MVYEPVNSGCFGDDSVSIKSLTLKYIMKKFRSVSRSMARFGLDNIDHIGREALILFGSSTMARRILPRSTTRTQTPIQFHWRFKGDERMEQQLLDIHFIHSNPQRQDIL